MCYTLRNLPTAGTKTLKEETCPMAEQKQRQEKLSLELTPEQLKEIAPLIERVGQVKIAGTVEGNKPHVSFIACNAAFKVGSSV
jgi:hypothetical protein